jgi:polyvinyl alcohol dehydrogenase (cytochrome)
LNTGKRLWKFQAIEDDGWILGCNPEKATERPENCPDRAQQNAKYHDVDFAAAPILRNLTNGRRVLLALNQAGIVYALDPDNGGRLLWKYSVEPGVFNFGAASDDRQLYAPIGIAEGRQENINAGRTISGMEAGGTGALAAIDIATGKRVWQTEAPQVSCDGVARSRDCGSSQGAAPLVIPGAVFAGARDGMLRAYSSVDGHIIWEFNSRREFETVNRVAARGGTMDGPGPVMVGGMLFVESGYSLLGSGIPGNVLLAFGVD